MNFKDVASQIFTYQSKKNYNFSIENKKSNCGDRFNFKHSRLQKTFGFKFAKRQKITENSNFYKKIWKKFAIV